MKKIVSVFLSFIFLYLIVFSAFSFKIDGYDNAVEWDGASVYKFIDGESNCGIDFGLVKVKFDYDSDALCLCFHYTDPELDMNNIQTGISLVIEDSSAFQITAADATCSDDMYDYCFDGAIVIDKNSGASCEIRIGFKSGLPAETDCNVQFIDSHGNYSNHYYFTVINELYESNENIIINPTADNTDPVYNPGIFSTTRKSAAEKSSSTKAKTSKPTTTKKSTVILPTEYIPIHVEIKSTPLYTGRKTTKRTTTKLATTSVETEKTPKSTKASKTKKETVKVYYYEKEVYISEVYITEVYITQSRVSTIDNTLPVVTECVNTTDVLTNANDIITSDIENTIENPKTVSLSTGSKIKTVICCFAFLGFAAIAGFGSYSAKKNGKINFKKRKK